MSWFSIDSHRPASGGSQSAKPDVAAGSRQAANEPCPTGSVTRAKTPGSSVAQQRREAGLVWQKMTSGRAPPAGRVALEQRVIAVRPTRPRSRDCRRRASRLPEDAPESRRISPEGSSAWPAISGMAPRRLPGIGRDDPGNTVAAAPSRVLARRSARRKVATRPGRNLGRCNDHRQCAHSRIGRTESDAFGPKIA